MNEKLCCNFNDHLHERSADALSFSRGNHFSFDCQERHRKTFVKFSQHANEVLRNLLQIVVFPGVRCLYLMHLQRSKHKHTLNSCNYIHYCLSCFHFFSSFCKLEFQIFFNLVFLVSFFSPLSLFQFHIIVFHGIPIWASGECKKRYSSRGKNALGCLFKLKFSCFARWVRTSHYWYAKFMSAWCYFVARCDAWAKISSWL